MDMYICDIWVVAKACIVGVYVWNYEINSGKVIATLIQFWASPLFLQFRDIGTKEKIILNEKLINFFI